MKKLLGRSEAIGKTIAGITTRVGEESDFVEIEFTDGSELILSGTVWMRHVSIHDVVNNDLSAYEWPKEDSTLEQIRKSPGKEGPYTI